MKIIGRKRGPTTNEKALQRPFLAVPEINS